MVKASGGVTSAVLVIVTLADEAVSLLTCKVSQGVGVKVSPEARAELMASQ
jgi:hypothetical protein